MFLNLFLYLHETSFSNLQPAALHRCFIVCRNRIISCSLSCVWSKKSCLWGRLHRVVIFCWRSFYTVWFVETFGFLFSRVVWPIFYMALWFPIYLEYLLICKLFVVSRTAGLPQYGQLGHGTDSEVCYYVSLFIFKGKLHFSTLNFHPIHNVSPCSQFVRLLLQFERIVSMCSLSSKLGVKWDGNSV